MIDERPHVIIYENWHETMALLFKKVIAEDNQH
jgi:hypothetical protein